MSISASGPGSFTGSSTTTTSAPSKAWRHSSNLVLDTVRDIYAQCNGFTDSLSSGSSNSSHDLSRRRRINWSSQPNPPRHGRQRALFRRRHHRRSIRQHREAAISPAYPSPPADGGPLTGSSTTSVSASKGVATFSNLDLDTAGTYTLKSSDSSDYSKQFRLQQFRHLPHNGAKIVLTGQPTSGTAGMALAAAESQHRGPVRQRRNGRYIQRLHRRHRTRIALRLFDHERERR